MNFAQIKNSLRQFNNSLISLRRNLDYIQTEVASAENLKNKYEGKGTPASFNSLQGKLREIEKMIISLERKGDDSVGDARALVQELKR